MFQLTDEEFGILKSQNAISSWGGTRKAPLVFTENGVAMLSGVLNSERAIEVNIQIMRTFTMIRRLIDTHKEVAQKISQPVLCPANLLAFEGSGLSRILANTDAGIPYAVCLGSVRRKAAKDEPSLRVKPLLSGFCVTPRSCAAEGTHRSLCLESGIKLALQM